MAAPSTRTLSAPTLVAALALAGIWAATAGPLIASGESWGIWDWDHHLASAEVERQAVFEHGVVPLWNPYVGGGIPLLQHPLGSAFCPDFLLLLPLGATLALKLLIAFRLAIGLLGGFLLGRAFGMPRLAAATLAVLVNTTGAYTAHVLYGHSEWSLLGYVPWILLGLLRFAERRRWTWGAVASLGIAMLYLGGAVYLLFALGFFWAAVVGVESLRGRPVRWSARSLLPFAIAAALVAVKLLPSVEFFQENPRRLGPMRPLFASTPPMGMLEVPRALYFMLVERGPSLPDDPRFLQHHRTGRYTTEELTKLLHYRRDSPLTREEIRERGRILDLVNFRAYFGLLPLLLVPFAFIARERLVPGIAAGTGVLLFLALSDPIGRMTGFFPWQALRELPLLGTLRTSGRFLVVAAVGLGILSAIGLHEVMRRWRPRGRITAAAVAGAVLLVVTVDHGARNAAALSKAFPFPPQTPERAAAFTTHLNPVKGSDYATVLARVGAVRGHSNLFLQTGVLHTDYGPYRGEAFLWNGPGEARLVHIRPNEVEVAVETSNPDVLVVNQTYLGGWRRSDREAPVQNAGGRVATGVVPTDGTVRLEYRPRFLTVGGAISGLTLLALVGLVAVERRRLRS